MSVMVPLYIHTTNFAFSTVDMVKSRAAAVKSHYSDRGASALEYVGLVLIAALILGALWAVFNALGLQTKIQNAVNQILTGATPAPPKKKHG